MAENNMLDDPNRRNFLIKATSIVGGAGVAAACLPFVASMNPSSDVLAKATTEVDLSGIPEDGVHTVAWQGKPIFIFHRNPEEIKAMEASEGGFDPEPDSKRVKKPQWLVVVGVCTHMGCMTIAGVYCVGPRRKILKCHSTDLLPQTKSLSAKLRGDHEKQNNYMDRPAFPAHQFCQKWIN
jgi:ubiquinol-cytochrome c reductase iron-sulfur subunit